MQHITTWPGQQQIKLPVPVKETLIKHLNEPFESEQQAIDFWQTTQTQLIILDKNESQNINKFLKQLDENQQQTLKQALVSVLDYPEYKEALIAGYTIQLAILSDAGEGVYCIMPVM